MHLSKVSLCFAGLIKGFCGDDCYFVEDSLGYVEKIWREDIIANEDSSNQTIRVRSEE